MVNDNSYIGDTASDNTSTTQAEAPVSYVVDTPTPPIDNAGSALGVNPVAGRAGRQYAWLRVGGPAPDSCARSVRPGTVDLACSGADPSLRLDRAEGAI
jgi:hypothetical protein